MRDLTRDQLLIIIDVADLIIGQVQSLQHLKLAQVWSIVLRILNLVPIEPQLFQNITQVVKVVKPA